MLQELGVDMGPEFVPSSYKNPWGTYEELELYKLNRRVFSGESQPSDYAAYVAEREAAAYSTETGVWGMKDPALSQVLHFILPYLNDAGIVVMRRNPEDVIESFNNVELMGINAARQWCAELTEKLEEQLAAFDGPVLELNWEDVKEDPAAIVEELTTFCYEGLPIRPGNEMKAKAIEHIKPTRKVKGFGSVAIGVRIGDVPEPDFFTSWTGMLLKSVKKGDTVLAPEAGQARHTASTMLARKFLRSGRDTLLMVDDDMMFEPRTLEHMRTRQENFDYDIVSCLATHKTWPPKPIVMKLKDPSLVSEMDRLKGDHFDLYSNFTDGDIEPVDAVGLAFTLIRRDVFMAMLHPDYGLEYSFFFPSPVGWESDDIPFSRRCREAGAKMAVDTNTKVYHIGRRAMGYEQFKAWHEAENQADVEFAGDDLMPILRHVANSQNGYSEKARVMLEMIGNATQE
jgi:hypothetical protein